MNVIPTHIGLFNPLQSPLTERVQTPSSNSVNWQERLADGQGPHVSGGTLTNGGPPISRKATGRPSRPLTSRQGCHYRTDLMICGALHPPVRRCRECLPVPNPPSLHFPRHSHSPVLSLNGRRQLKLVSKPPTGNVDRIGSRRRLSRSVADDFRRVALPPPRR